MNFNVAANSKNPLTISNDNASSSSVVILDREVKSYSVQKIRRGIKQSRILKLTSHEIWNCKGTTITACHSLQDIFCVTLKDDKTLCISFVNDHDFVYQSDIAIEIFNEINSRLADIRTKEKEDLTSALATAAQNYQEKLHRLSMATNTNTVKPTQNQPNNSNNNPRKSMVMASVSHFLNSNNNTTTKPNISTKPIDLNNIENMFDSTSELIEAKLFDSNALDNNNNSSDNINVATKYTSPKSTLAPIYISPNTVNPNDTINLTISSNAANTNSPTSADTSASISSNTSSSTPAPSLSSPTPRRANNKLAQLTGESEYSRIQSYIDKLILDNTTDEGKSRTKFLKSWPNLKKKPSSVLAAIRQFMDSLANYMQKKRITQIKKLVTNEYVAALNTNNNPTSPNNNNNAANNIALIESELYKQIERSIETGIVLPLYTRIMEIVKLLSKSQDDIINNNINRLKIRDQSWFGIKSKQI